MKCLSIHNFVEQLNPGKSLNFKYTLVLSSCFSRNRRSFPRLSHTHKENQKQQQRENMYTTVPSCSEDNFSKGTTRGTLDQDRGTTLQQEEEEQDLKPQPRDAGTFQVSNIERKS